MKKVVKAVFILSLFTLLERGLGFFFKIYLSQQLGAAALGVYQVAISVFFMLLTLITSGIPLVVSKMTAKFRLQKNFGKESSLASAAVIVSLALSVLITAVVLIFNRPIGKLFSDGMSRTILLILLPALMFSAVYSALRGNLWGRQKYTAASLLELTEQIARIIVCMALFAAGYDKLKGTALSLTISCGISALVCVICYFALGSRLHSPKGQFKPLIKQSAPITAARASTSAVGGIIAILAPALLVFSGLSKDQAMYEYGYSMGMAMPLIYIPLTIVGSLAFVMIPSLSEASASKDTGGVKRQVEGAIKSSLILGVLFFPLFYALGEPIGAFVFRNSDGAGVAAGAFLKQAAWLLIPISVESITSSMLNSLDLEIRGFIHYAMGSLVMFAIFLAFCKNFSMQILSIGMGISWIISSILNLAVMRKRLKISFGFLVTLALALVLCVPAVYLTRWLYSVFAALPAFFRIGFAGGIGLVFLTALNFVFGLLKIEFFTAAKPKPKNQIKNCKADVKTVA